MRIVAAAGERLTGAALGRSRLKLGGLDRGKGCLYHTDLPSAGELGVSSRLCCLLHLLLVFTSSSYVGCCKDTLEMWSE